MLLLHRAVSGISTSAAAAQIHSESRRLLRPALRYYVFKNAIVYDKIEVLDLYIYRMGMQLGDYYYATAVGIMKSVVSVVMLAVANLLARRVRGTSIV